MTSERSAARNRRHAVLSLPVLALAAGAFLLAAAPATAKPTCRGQQATIKGTPQSETIEGTEAADVIRARAGNDTILALGGDDVVCGGLGSDTADGAEGNDAMNGGEGDDTFTAGGGDDHVFGHTGDDTADGGAGIDECRVDEHTECEADLRLQVTGPDSVTHGDQTVFPFNVNLRNNGLTPAVNTRVDLALPSNPGLGTAEFVPASSDSRCSENAPGMVRCNFGAMGVDNDTDGAIGLRFPQCFPQGDRPLRGVTPTDALDGTALDMGTSDPVSGNDSDSASFTFGFADECNL